MRPPPPTHRPPPSSGRTGEPRSSLARELAARAPIADVADSSDLAGRRLYISQEQPAAVPVVSTFANPFLVRTTFFHSSRSSVGRVSAPVRAGGKDAPSSHLPLRGRGCRAAAAGDSAGGRWKHVCRRRAHRCAERADLDRAGRPCPRHCPARPSCCLSLPFSLHAPKCSHWFVLENCAQRCPLTAERWQQTVSLTGCGSAGEPVISASGARLGNPDLLDPVADYGPGHGPHKLESWVSEVGIFVGKWVAEENLERRGWWSGSFEFQ
jgi:hypothetical protein